MAIVGTMPAMGMVRTQIQFTEEQLEKLRRLAEREETSISDVVRRAVDAAMTTIVAMRALAIRQAFAYDDDFADQGFDVLV